MYPVHGNDLETLIQHADVAMHAAKHDHSGVRTYDAARDRNCHSRLSLLGELNTAISRGELVLYYQPQIQVRTGQVAGVEALVRWQHPRPGLVPPDRFVPLAEHTELMTPFTDWVVGTALEPCRAWHDNGMLVGVAVNAIPSGRHTCSPC